MSKKAKHHNKGKWSLIFLFIFIALMCYSGYKIVMWLIENTQSQQIIQEIANKITITEDSEKNEKKYNVNFSDLKAKNEDTVAWLKVNGTGIEFPVVQSNNNDFYMNHSFDKSSNGAGWIFADYKNKLDGTDRNIVIFGHNRRDGSMFGTLKNILNKEWYETEENLTIPFITEKEYAKYQVFSVYTLEAEDYYITTNFASNESFANFIEKIKSRSIKNFGIEVTGEDKILTLSTCADNNKYRVVLHAKKINN